MRTGFAQKMQTKVYDSSPIKIEANNNMHTFINTHQAKNTCADIVQAIQSQTKMLTCTQ